MFGQQNIDFDVKKKNKRTKTVRTTKGVMSRHVVMDYVLDKLYFRRGHL